MRLTKLGHSCIRIEHDGAVIVLDPGVFTAPGATDGADAVLITHEHPDHYDAAHLRATDAPIFTIAAVAAQIREGAPDLAERVTIVGPGEAFAPAGIPVTAVGELHAVIHPEMQRFDNSGYLLTLGDTTVFHPGDALTGPDRPVDVLLAPVCAPWMKVAEGIDFARSVGAPRNVAIHDRVYSDAGLAIADNHFGRFLGAAGLDYRRLADGAEL
ncbi:MBL fold metallo-hydrolase [Nocardioides humilatus]|uniref:MBL fold metallo-hydrolase n=1 Tax=Nocardioides humilatus TaxID=2607660 RepID=A0A5B1LFP8_9ACTN|nr:MBL fold metallo-hydrolase [Nocardioides humilatus]KAA1419502.1 MBL fold metallo-hydrolase [Nocardioides humilatus]